MDGNHHQDGDKTKNIQPDNMWSGSSSLNSVHGRIKIVMCLFAILILRRNRTRTLLESLRNVLIEWNPERSAISCILTFGSVSIKTLTFLDPELVDIIGKRLSQLPVKQLGKIGTADRKDPLQIRQA
mgnify:CR=1 FL=1